MLEHVVGRVRTTTTVKLLVAEAVVPLAEHTDLDTLGRLVLLGFG